jgi:hypothetical protein
MTSLSLFTENQRQKEEKRKDTQLFWLFNEVASTAKVM